MLMFVLPIETMKKNAGSFVIWVNCLEFVESKMEVIKIFNISPKYQSHDEFEK